jgi:predicted permease
MTPAFEALAHDVRFGWRMMRKRPTAALLSVCSLALAVGVGTAFFSIVNAILLRPLPYHEPERLVMLWNVNEKAGFTLNQQRAGGRSMSIAEYLDWKDQTEIFEHVLLFSSYLTRLAKTENPEVIFGFATAPGLFPMLGVTPLIGRGFLPEDEKPGAGNVAVLQHEFWQRRFGGDPNVLGSKIYLSNEPTTVIGVFRPGFVFFSRQIDFLSAASWSTENAGRNRAGRYYRSMARLKPGLTLAQAQARADVFSAGLAARYPANQGWHVMLVPVQEDAAGEIRPAILTLFIAVGCVLLIACVNVTNLLLVEATVRARELALRSALGAGRFQLIRLLLTQSMALALAGGALGFGLAWALVRYFQSILPDRFSHVKFLTQVEAIGIDSTVVAFAIGLVLLSGLLFGLLPAWQAARPDFNRVLKDAGTGSVGGLRARTLRRGLVIAEVAIAVVLVIGAVLLVRTMVALYNRGPGYRPEHLISMEVQNAWEDIADEIKARTFATAKERNDYSQQRYKQADFSFRDRLFAKLQALPGVTGFTVTGRPPLSSYYYLTQFTIEGREVAPGKECVGVVNPVGTSFFTLLGIPLLKGRFFGREDRPDGVNVALVSAEWARRWFGTEDPLGKRFKIGDAKSTSSWLTIVGVVGDINEDGLDRPPQPYFYLLDEQNWLPGYLIVRSALKPEAVMPAVRRAILETDSKAAVYRVLAMSDTVRSSTWRVYYSMLLLGGLAGLAFAMALVGVYGVLSYSVRERTQEIGVRMALGADRGDVVRLVIREGLTQVAIGIFIGLAGALALTRFLRTLLYGVGPFDPATFAVVAVGLMIAGLLASYLPARRAAKVDPMVALRCE